MVETVELLQQGRRTVKTATARLRIDVDAVQRKVSNMVLLEECTKLFVRAIHSGKTEHDELAELVLHGHARDKGIQRIRFRFRRVRNGRWAGRVRVDGDGRVGRVRCGGCIGRLRLPQQGAAVGQERGEPRGFARIIWSLCQIQRLKRGELGERGAPAGLPSGETEGGGVLREPDRAELHMREQKESGTGG